MEVGRSFFRWKLLIIEGSVFGIMYGCLRGFEYNDQLETALSLYEISKWICGIFIVVALVGGITECIKRKRVFLVYISMILLIPVFNIVVNGRIPKRFEKLGHVILIRDGVWEQRKDTMDYLVYYRTEYGGKIGKEDVLFMPNSQKKDEAAYYIYPYLYSDDDQVDAYTGVWEDIRLWHLDGKWYKVELRLFY